MADLKLQVFQGTTDSADFRGDKLLGADTDPVDRHATIAEVRIPDDRADEALALCEEFNAAADTLASQFGLKLAGQLASLGLGGEGAPRVAARLYDND